MEVFGRGGNAVDAAIAANAAIAVTAPHLCGLGGDLFAIVRTPDGELVGLNATGRAGSGSDAAALRAEGHASMPMRHDIRTATVPGAVDGWMLLHERFGSADLATILAPAVRLAASGFPASPLLVRSLETLDEAARERFAELAERATSAGCTHPPARRRAHAAGDRRRWPRGVLRRRVRRGPRSRSATASSPTADLATVQADWVTPLTAERMGRRPGDDRPELAGLPLPRRGPARRCDRSPARRRRRGVGAPARRGRGDRRLRPPGRAPRRCRRCRARRRDRGARRRSSTSSGPGARPVAAAPGDTTYLCTADASGMAVSLIQSNASGFGSWLVEPTTGINIHNRGLGFSLQPGHPAELAPGRRPPHTLCPAMATRDGELAAVFGSMGGDAQPQILLQVAARLFAGGEGVADAIAAPRWALQGRATGFDTWTSGAAPRVAVEGHAPEAWRDGAGGTRPRRRRRAGVRLRLRARPRDRRRADRRVRRSRRPTGAHRRRSRRLIDRCRRVTRCTAWHAPSAPASPAAPSTCPARRAGSPTPRWSTAGCSITSRRTASTCSPRSATGSSTSTSACSARSRRVTATRRRRSVRCACAGSPTAAGATCAGPTACEVLSPSEVDAIHARLGPDPLARRPDGTRAFARIARSRAPVAGLLMDQAVVAGHRQRLPGRGPLPPPRRPVPARPAARRGALAPAVARPRRADAGRSAVGTHRDDRARPTVTAAPAPPAARTPTTCTAAPACRAGSAAPPCRWRCSPPASSTGARPASRRESLVGSGGPAARR